MHKWLYKVRSPRPYPVVIRSHEAGRQHGYVVVRIGVLAESLQCIEHCAHNLLRRTAAPRAQYFTKTWGTVNLTRWTVCFDESIGECEKSMILFECPRHCAER